MLGTMEKEDFIDVGTACTRIINIQPSRRQVLERISRQAAVASAMAVGQGMMTTSLAVPEALGTRKQLLLMAMLDNRSKNKHNKINSVIRLTCCNKCR